MSRLKVRDLQLTERKWPLLVRASYQTDLLHISMHNGTWKNPRKYANNRYFVTTKCNRPFEHPVHFKTSFEKLGDFQLCSTCGTQAGFEIALETYKAGLETERLGLQEEDAKRQAERKRAAEARTHLASRIASLLNATLALKAWAEKDKVFVECEDILYRLPVMKEHSGLGSQNP